MPEICRFYGIVIKMYFRKSEHNPPHFHAIYGEYVGELAIETGKVIAGDLPEKALGLVQEWASAHRAELMRIWEEQSFTPIEPLI